MIPIWKKSKNKISWGNIDGSVGNGINLQLTNGKLFGTYRIWDGSASDAYTDVVVSIELKSNNTLLFQMDDKIIEATKLKK